VSAPVQGSADAQTPLRWIEEILGWTADDGSPSPAAPGRSLWALPRAHRARTLVPDVRHGGRTLWVFNDSMSQIARLKKAGLGAALDMGMGSTLRLDRVRMIADEAGEGSIQAYLGAIMSHPVSIGVFLGNDLRPNRKPVLQILGPQGRVEAFAKVGWNDHTKALVDNEARALARIASCRPATFRAPAVISHASWQDRTVLVVAADRLPLLRRGRRNTAPDVALELEVLRSGPRSHEPLDTSGYGHDLVRRMSSDGLDRGVGERLRHIFDGVVSQIGGREMPFGAWHGDWTPWNMARSGSGTLVFDWERYGGPVPAGFDHLHLRFQRAHQVLSRPVEASLSEAARSLGAVAPRFELDPRLVRANARLYVMEMVLRSEEGRVAGMKVDDALVPSILKYLEVERS
jgi:hypothetical protein